MSLNPPVLVLSNHLLGSISVSGRKYVIIPLGPLTGEIEIDKFYGENIAYDKIIVSVIIEGDIARAHVIKQSLLAHEPLGSDEKFHNNVFADVVGQYCLHGAYHFRVVEALLGRRAESRGYIVVCAVLLNGCGIVSAVIIIHHTDLHSAAACGIVFLI